MMRLHGYYTLLHYNYNTLNLLSWKFWGKTSGGKMLGIPHYLSNAVQWKGNGADWMIANDEAGEDWLFVASNGRWVSQRRIDMKERVQVLQTFPFVHGIELPADIPDYPKTSGQIAFEAYREAAHGRDVRGGWIPDWNALNPPVRDCWEAAGLALRNAWAAETEAACAAVAAHHRALSGKREPFPLDERETAKLRHALIYQDGLTAAGIAGHTDYMLLARLAQHCGFELGPTEQGLPVLIYVGPE